MVTKNVRRTSTALLASSCLMSLVRGWGEVGHQVVASIAYDYLTGSQAPGEVTRLLKVVGANSMVDVANWADQFAKEPGNAWAEPCHYFDQTRGQDNMRATWNETCGPCCVVGAIFNYTNLLQDRQQYSDQFDADALRFLVHYVGDVHQPLHIGFKDDLGGNLIELTFEGKATRLHGVWDYDMIEYWNQNVAKTAVDDWKPLAAHVKSSITPDLAKQWGQSLDPVDWAIESHNITETHVYDSDEVKQGGTVTSKYVDSHFDAVVERLGMAGVRLGLVMSNLLNKA